MSEFEYTHPKILAIDLDRTVVSSLQNSGLNIEPGTFGSPYKVFHQNEFYPVIINHNLPENLTNKKLVIIDLSAAMYIQQQTQVSGQFSYWAKPDSFGLINPRYLSMDLFRKDFDRIYNNGGIFIIFANNIDEITIKTAKDCISPVVEKLEIKKLQNNDKKYNNWSFLTEINLPNLSITKLFGRKIEVEKSFIYNLLCDYQNNFRHYCQVFPEKNEIKRKWSRLARDMHNLTIAGVINELSEGKGLILLLPNIPNSDKKSSFLFKLITEYLPKIVPDLCKKDWLTLPEYEIPKIQRVKNKLESILAEHQQRLSKLEMAIAEERKKLSYWHDLITSTDRPLIDAVKKAFHVLGFKQIIDPDNNQEDLQIKDYRPILLLEIIGTSEECIDDTKIWQYLAPRMQEYKTFEVKGLIIVNYQKDIPPLARDNENIFSQTILDKAKEYNLGLITTWDIYRLMRNYLKFGWKHDRIKDIFYQTGKIDPIPSHYQYIGIVEDFDKLQNTVKIKLEKLYLQKGDIIAFDFAVEIEEQKIENIKQNDKNIEIIKIGNLTAAIATKLSQEELKHEIRLFKILEE